MKENPGEDQNMVEAEDPVPVITRKHFEEALAAARKSVTAYDLDKFE
jgi:transitional endoplasmic reticulum ATPase